MDQNNNFNDQKMNQGYNNQGYGQNMNQGYDPNMGQNNYGAPVQSSKSKVAAGLFAIFLGGFGVHKFYLGYAAEGGILLGANLVCAFVLPWFTFGLSWFVNSAIWIICLIEGILYLTKSDEDFYNMYVLNKKPWF